MIREALPRDVLRELFYHCRILLHGDHTARDQLSMLLGRKMPRSYPHQVVKREFQDQPALCDNLKRHKNKTLRKFAFKIRQYSVIS